MSPKSTRFEALNDEWNRASPAAVASRDQYRPSIVNVQQTLLEAKATAPWELPFWAE